MFDTFDLGQRQHELRGQCFQHLGQLEAMMYSLWIVTKSRCSSPTTVHFSNHQNEASARNAAVKLAYGLADNQCIRVIKDAECENSELVAVYVRPLLWKPSTKNSSVPLNRIRSAYDLAGFVA